jgi:DNA mismatch repair protein MutL
VDKHAAHERVIFEDLKANRERDGRVSSQTLLLPLSVVLTPEELSCAEEYKDELSSVGFEYVINGKNADITAIPSAIGTTDAENLFIKMTDEIISGAGKPEITEAIRREKALYQIACKAAIKGGRVYDKSVIEWLIAKVLLLPDITVCPHGRPIAYRLTKNELDRQFERIK